MYVYICMCENMSTYISYIYVYTYMYVPQDCQRIRVHHGPSCTVWPKEVVFLSDPCLMSGRLVPAAVLSIIDLSLQEQAHPPDEIVDVFMHGAFISLYSSRNGID